MCKQQDAIYYSFHKLMQTKCSVEVTFINSNGLVRLMGGQGSCKVLEQVAVSQWPSRVAS